MSNELGAGRPEAARLAVCVVVVMAVSEGALVGLALVLLRNLIGFAYSSDTEVVKYVATMMPIIAVSNFLDGLQCVLSGLKKFQKTKQKKLFNFTFKLFSVSGNARGCGWQKIGACVNLGAYYLVGIPLSVVFAFVLHIGGKVVLLRFLTSLFDFFFIIVNVLSFDSSPLFIFLEYRVSGLV